MSDFGEIPTGIVPTEPLIQPGFGAKLIGKINGPRELFWFQSGLSLLTDKQISPRDFLERFEKSSIPGKDITTGDMVVFFRGDQLYTKQIESKRCIDTSRLDLLRLGAAYVTATDQVRVISQDECGNVWNHSIEQLPGYNEDNWDFYGLRLPTNEGYGSIHDPTKPRPLNTLDAWLHIKP